MGGVSVQVALDAGGDVDPVAIGSKIEKIGSIERFQPVTKQCTDSRTIIAEIAESVTEVAAVNGHMDEVRAEESTPEG